MSASRRVCWKKNLLHPLAKTCTPVRRSPVATTTRTRAPPKCGCPPPKMHVGWAAAPTHTSAFFLLSCSWCIFSVSPLYALAGCFTLFFLFFFFPSACTVFLSFFQALFFVWFFKKFFREHRNLLLVVINLYIFFSIESCTRSLMSWGEDEWFF